MRIPPVALPLSFLLACKTGAPPLVDRRCLDVPPVGAIWVQPGGEGDGSKDDPVGSLDDALASAPAGPIALLPGTYADVPELGSAQDGLWLGAPCGAATLTTTKQGPTLAVHDTTVALVGLEIEGGQPGLEVQDSTVQAQELQIEGATRAGVEMHGTNVVTLDDSVILDMQLDNNDQGYGVYLDDSTVFTATNLTIARTWGAAIQAHDTTSRVDLVGLRVDDTLRVPDGVAGVAVALADGVSGSIEDARLENSVSVHLATSGNSKRATIRLADVELGVVAPRAYDDGDPSTRNQVTQGGLAFGGAGTVELTRITARGPVQAVSLVPASGSLSATIDGLDVELDDAHGVGLIVGQDASATASNVSVRGMFLFGVAATEGSLNLTDPVIQGEWAATSDAGIGIAATDGGTLQVDGGEVSGVRGFGAAVTTDATMTLNGTHIWGIGTLEAEAGTSAVGIAAVTGGTLEGDALLLEQIPGVAIAARTGGSITVTNSVIQDITGVGSYSGYAGMLISAAGEDETRVTIKQSSVRNVLGSGFIAWGPEAHATIKNTTISNLQAPDPSSTEGAGALLAYAGAFLEASDVVIDSVQGNGVFVDASEGFDPDDLDSASRVELTDVEVAHVTSVAESPAAAASVQSRGELDWASGSIHDIDGPGLYVAQGGVSAADLQIFNVEFAGMAVQVGGVGWLDTCTIHDVFPSGTYGGGMGVWANGELYGYDVNLDDVELDHLPLAGVVAVGEGRMGLRSGSYRGIDGVALGTANTFGNAVIAVGLGASDSTNCSTNQSGLCIDGTTFQSDAAPMVLLDGSSGYLCGLQAEGDAPTVVQTGCASGGIVSTCADEPVYPDTCADDVWPIPGIETLTISVSIPDVELVNVDVPEATP